MVWNAAWAGLSENKEKCVKNPNDQRQVRGDSLR